MVLSPGDPGPKFTASGVAGTPFRLDEAAGRSVMLCFFASSAIPYSAALLEQVSRIGTRLVADGIRFVGVSIDPDDRVRLSDSPGRTYVIDEHLSISGAYGAVGDRPRAGGDLACYDPRTVILDRSLRVRAMVPFAGEPGSHLNAILHALQSSIQR
jgi:peroxiredoxin